MRLNTFRFPALILSIALAMVLAGCASPKHRAPVEDRSTGVSKPVVAPAPQSQAPSAEVKPMPGAENAGKPGFYTVKSGDSLIRIALDHGQNWKDLVKWNSLDNPNLIEVGQVLRVVSPAVDAAATSAKPINQAKVEARPLDSKPAVAAPVVTTPPASASAGTVAASAASAPAVTRDADSDIQWIWPSQGSVIAGFDERQNNKGLSIGGKTGDAVVAAADGRVIFAGSVLRGYGNMIIIKHNETYLSAYAHNQTLLVKEDQVVRRGQKIAEMGSSDADRVKLHFEVRKFGKPVDPAKVLPTR